MWKSNNKEKFISMLKIKNNMLKYIKKCYYRIKCKIIKFTGGKYGEKFKKNNGYYLIVYIS